LFQVRTQQQTDYAASRRLGEIIGKNRGVIAAIDGGEVSGRSAEHFLPVVKALALRQRTTITHF
jgi:hypothetical protein